MRRIKGLVLVLILLLHSFTTECAFTFSSTDDPTLTALFNPQQKGWLGGDVSTSIQLINDEYLWIFGDSFYGNIAKNGNAEYRNASIMPHSSLGFLNMSKNESPSFYFRPLIAGGAQLDPMGIFRSQNPTNENEFYWIVAGSMSPNTGCLVILAQVTIDTNTGLGFEQIGTDVIVVQNPLKLPSEWIYTTSRIPSSNLTLSWNSGLAFDDGYFYLVGLINGQAPLARITETDLVKYNWEGLEYWSKGLAWESNVENLEWLYSSVYTEGTLQWHPYMQCWFLILGQAFQGQIQIAFANSITGPYTLSSVYSIPSQYQNGTFFAYAGKSHPEFASDDQEIVFTYNVNCNSLSLLLNDLDIYHPKFVRVAIQKS